MLKEGYISANHAIRKNYGKYITNQNNYSQKLKQTQGDMPNIPKIFICQGTRLNFLKK